MTRAKQVCYTQTVDIPASHRLTIDVPREVPEGAVILTFTPKAPVAERKKERVPGSVKGDYWMADDFDAPDPEIEALFHGEPLPKRRRKR